MKTYLKTPFIDLRGLTEAERDAKINEAVHYTTHERIAGYSPVKIDPYATSADAVLPLLEKWHWSREIDGNVCLWKTDNSRPPTYSTKSSMQGRALIFPLAACYALLRAHGWEVLT